MSGKEERPPQINKQIKMPSLGICPNCKQEEIVIYDVRFIELITKSDDYGSCILIRCNTCKMRYRVKRSDDKFIFVRSEDEEN